jgi:hypothetical protein
MRASDLPHLLPGYPNTRLARHRYAVASGNSRFRFIEGMTNAIEIDEPHLNREG